LLLVAEQVAKVGTGRVVVATDNLDAGIGDEVLVAFGSGARNAISPGSRDVLVDAAVVQIIDGSNS
jgi:microcompartment protein CcmK/EutM